jgi:oligopeptide/dipeptide ABC transporter ATP-binding protein
MLKRRKTGAEEALTPAPQGDAPVHAPLLAVSSLMVEFPRGRGRPPLRAVDGVSFDVLQRETVGLVGESGSGKTTIGRAVLGLAEVSRGEVILDGEDITHATAERRRALSADLQVVFQDPHSSLNPARTIGQTLGETLRVHQRDLARDALAARVAAMLDQVGLPASAASRYPAHFSGGQRQRIAIARALIAQPRLVICDEPTSALDLSVQAQVLNLLQDLQDRLQLSYLFVSHDLAVVRYVSHRVIVLCGGQVMEAGPVGVVCDSPVHPYTQALLAAAPVCDPEAQRHRRTARSTSFQTGPSLSNESCPFASRCRHAIEVCRTQRPLLEQTPAGALVACHRWSEIDHEAAQLSLRNGAASPSAATPR